ncbi:ABC transporter permease [Sporichthya polymorpha]|uniref:ABC transporter permease n=1 Tax=Sporichthya polymorpha TaxID=35751 RepID=UPI00036A64B9|nr:ABC transporter permease [Sporichthya polymorpha]
MVRTVLHRLGQAALTLLGGALIVFALLQAAPGDPALRILTARGQQDVAPEAVAAMRAELGLDDPFFVRLRDFLHGLLTGDLGTSWQTGRPVTDEFAGLVEATAILTVSALALAVLGSLALGLLAAAWPGRLPDLASRSVTLVCLVVPSFVFGILLLDVLVVELGFGRVIADGTWGTVGLPALTLALGSIAAWSRILRAGLLEAGSAPYLRVAQARGAGPARRLFVHQLPNALPAYLTLIGMESAFLLAGAPVVESVFTWPGIGRYTVQAVEARDMPVVTGFALLAIGLFVLTSLLVDLFNLWLDPRLRQEAT